MKTLGIRALRENPGVISQSALAGEYILLTNRNKPISLSIPFNDELINSGAQLTIACKLFEEGVLTLSKAATFAGLSVEALLSKMAKLGITLVDQCASELADDLKAIDK